jgi:hypothetical protein
MGILTQIVAAEEDEVEDIGASPHPLDEWSGIEMRDIDIPKIATLHCLLTGDSFDEAIAVYEPILFSAEGALVLRLDDQVAAHLAMLEEDALDAVAQELVATEEFEIAGWESEAVAEMLFSLADLARLAESQAQVLFVWLHPLRT